MRNGAVAIIFGTRPELVKLAPLIAPLGAAATVIHTGQHSPTVLAPIARDLGLDDPSVALAAPTGPPRTQIHRMVERLAPLLAQAAPEVVVVQGDTNSTLAGALAAAAVGLPIVHVEAGLRAGDPALPEEHNRVLVDHLATRLCAPTETARAHLLAEGIPAHRIAVTGNTVVDAAIAALAPAAERDRFLARHALRRDEYVVATFHRQENVDDPARLTEILAALHAVDGPVVFPVHPRTRDRMRHHGLDGTGGDLRLIDPLGYRDFLALEADCALVISDSGGVQEEASVFGRPVIVVRRSTERPEVLGTVARLVPDVGQVAATANELLAQRAAILGRLAILESPYGDGTAGAQCVEIVTRLVAHAAHTG